MSEYPSYIPSYDWKFSECPSYIPSYGDLSGNSMKKFDHTHTYRGAVELDVQERRKFDHTPLVLRNFMFIEGLADLRSSGGKKPKNETKESFIYRSFIRGLRHSFMLEVTLRGTKAAI